MSLHPLNPIVYLLLLVIRLYEDVLLVWVILSFLISFGIVNRSQPFVQRVNFALFRMTDPLLRPIRKYMPDLGGIDISPIIAIIVLEFLSYTILYYS